MKKNFGKKQVLHGWVCVALVLVLCTFASCGASKSSDMAVQEAEYAGGAVMNMKMARAESAVEMYDMDAVYDESAIVTNGTSLASENGKALSTEEVERKLIYTGNLRLQVTSLTSTESAIQDWVSAFKGYITSSSTNGRNLNVTARIPAKSFFSAFDEAGNLGTVENRDISTEDVTEQFYDLSTRLNTRKIFRERLQSYLSNAKDMKDLLSIEAELSNVQSDIEVMEGRFRRLSNQIDYATIHIRASLPSNTTERGYNFPNMTQKMRNLGENSLEFLASFVVGILYLVIYGVPLVAIVALLYWLCFGRIGLIKKLFTFLSSKKRTNDNVKTE